MNFKKLVSVSLLVNILISIMLWHFGFHIIAAIYMNIEMICGTLIFSVLRKRGGNVCDDLYKHVQEQ